MIMAMVTAIIILLLGVPVLLHLTKDASEADPKTMINHSNRNVSEDVRVADVDPDEERLKEFFTTYVRYSESALEGDAFNSRLTGADEALFAIVYDYPIVDYDAYPGERSPRANWEDNLGKVDPLQMVKDKDLFGDFETPYYLAFDQEKVDWIMRNILNYSQEGNDVRV